MYRVTREMSFSYGHRLCEYEGKCSRIHGHNGRLRVTLEAATLDAAGMVIDFFDIKRALSAWIDESLDHRLILRTDDPAVVALRDIGEPVYAVPFNPTAENIARHVFEHLASLGLPVVEVQLEETANCTASYTGPEDR